MPSSFPALRGVLGDTEYYTAIVTLGEAARLVGFVADADDWGSETDPRSKSQRRLNEARVERELVPYLLEAPDHFYGALVVEIRPLPGREASFHFAVDQDVVGAGPAQGRLELDGTEVLCALDGQHRLRSIQLALRERPALAAEHIAVVFVPFRSTRRSQLLFADLNRYARPPSRSLTLLFSHRDPLVPLVNELMARVPILDARVELESTSLARYSPNFITFSTLYEMTALMRHGDGRGGRAGVLREADRLAAIWQSLTETIGPWQAVADRREHPSYLRPRYVAMHGVGQQAIAHSVAKMNGVGLERLGQVDWSVTNPDWQGIAVQGARVYNTPSSVRALAASVLFAIGAPIDRQSAANLGTLIRARGDTPPDSLVIAAKEDYPA